MGLYKIVYVSKQTKDHDSSDKKDTNSSDKNDHEILENIIKCLTEIPKKYFDEENFLTLLSELFSPIAHLVKDESYKHENEYRLMFIGSIKDNKEFIYDDNQHGIYIETEAILFKEMEDYEGQKIPHDKIFFGPKLDEITVLKYKHLFEYDELTADIKKSHIQYR